MSTIAVDNVKPSAGGASIELIASLVKAIANTVTDAGGSSGTVNQTSITDGGTGSNTHTFTNSFASVDYGHTGNIRHSNDNNYSVAQRTDSDATGSCLINTATVNGTNVAYGYDVQWVGDLA